MNSLYLNGEMTKAVDAFRNENYALSTEICRQIITSSPGHAPALELLGNALWRQKQYEEATSILKQACNASNPAATAWHSYGFACLSLRHLNDAVNALGNALRLDPENSKSRLQLAKAHYLSGNLGAAYSVLEKHGPEDALMLVKNALSDIESVSNLVHCANPISESTTETIAFERREFFPHLFNKLDLVETGVEIGVQQGGFSETLLANWKGKRLVSIDPWKEFPAKDYDDIANYPQEKHDAFYIETLIRLRPYGNRSVVWRLTSEQAAGLIGDRSLDFCYIDADHSYKGCSMDIKLWFPKVKSGGILAGHDYIPDGQYPHGNFGVRKAVREFAAEHNLNLFITQETDTDCWSWFVCKILKF